MRITILGAGITGLSLGCMLSDKGMNICFGKLERHLCTGDNTK